jgi:hypothetical protein
MALPLTLILDVRFYATKAGAEPVRDWLRSHLTTSERSSATTSRRFRSAGPLVCPWCATWSRDGPIMVLVHGFIKKTKQTPKQDIELARKRMKEVRHG